VRTPSAEDGTVSRTSANDAALGIGCHSNTTSAEAANHLAGARTFHNNGGSLEEPFDDRRWAWMQSAESAIAWRTNFWTTKEGRRREGSRWEKAGAGPYPSRPETESCCANTGASAADRDVGRTGEFQVEVASELCFAPLTELARIPHVL
jgi:hypothetical protein